VRVGGKLQLQGGSGSKERDKREKKRGAGRRSWEKYGTSRPRKSAHYSVESLPRMENLSYSRRQRGEE